MGMEMGMPKISTLDETTRQEIVEQKFNQAKRNSRVLANSIITKMKQSQDGSDLSPDGSKSAIKSHRTMNLGANKEISGIGSKASEISYNPKNENDQFKDFISTNFQDNSQKLQPNNFRRSSIPLTLKVPLLFQQIKEEQENDNSEDEDDEFHASQTTMSKIEQVKSHKPGPGMSAFKNQDDNVTQMTDRNVN